MEKKKEDTRENISSKHIKVIAIVIMLLMILITSNNIYAKYVLTKEKNITISSAAFYFTAVATTPTSEYTGEEPIEVELKMETYEGSNSNQYVTGYEISIDDSGSKSKRIQNSRRYRKSEK